MPRPDEGAWRWLHDVADGRLLITTRHVCAVFGRKDRVPPPDGELDEAEAARLFRTFSGPFAGSQSAAEHGEEWGMDLTLVVTAHPRNAGVQQHRAIRVDGDEMRGEVVRPDGTRAPTDVHRRLSAPGTSPLAGAWQLVSDEWDGMLLMTDSQYRYVVASKDRPQITAPAADLSDADAAALYHTYDAQGGSYAVSGATMTRSPELARDPREQSHATVLEFSLDGDTLSTRALSGEESVWRKPE